MATLPYRVLGMNHGLEGPAIERGARILVLERLVSAEHLAQLPEQVRYRRPWLTPLLRPLLRLLWPPQESGGVSSPTRRAACYRRVCRWAGPEWRIGTGPWIDAWQPWMWSGESQKGATP